jgi:hypothetical protein
MMTVLKNLVDKLNCWGLYYKGAAGKYRSREKMDRLNRDVESMHFYCGTCLIKKKKF